MSILLALCVMTTPMRSLAQEEPNLIRVKLSGNAAFSAGSLKNLMLSKGLQDWRGLLIWKKPQKFNQILFDRDIARLIAFYQTEGFLQVDIKYRVEIQEKGNRCDAYIDIHEGAPVFIHSIHQQTTTTDTLVRARVQAIWEALQNELNLRTQQRFRDQSLKSAEEKIINRFLNQGFPYFSVSSEFELSADRTAVGVIFNLVPGHPSLFGDIEIIGAQRIPESIILRQVAFKAQQRYAQEKIQETQERIYQLGVFNYVIVKALLNQDQPTFTPIQIQVKEAARFLAQFSAGYGREDQFRATLELRRIGFLGNARTLAFIVRHSSLLPYQVAVRWISPGFPVPRATMIFNPFVQEEQEKAFVNRRAGFHVSHTQAFAKMTSGFTSLALEQDRVRIDKLTREMLPPRYVGQQYFKSTFTVGLKRDSSYPLFNPRKGLYTEMTLKYSGIWRQTDTQYLQELFEIKYFKGLSWDWILACRLRVGAIHPVGTLQVTPIEDRFFSGGSNSVRGWARSELGPKSANDLPIGGDSLLEGSLELRFPVWNNFSGVAFCDLGNVWSGLAFPVKQLHYAWGIGVRFNTPIGPIRLDFARPIWEETTPWIFHLSVGQAF